MTMTKIFRAATRGASLVLLALLLAACDAGGASSPELPTALEIVSGTPQQATVDATLPNPLVVRVTDDDGDPVPGAVVNFMVTAGGGTLDGATATTGSDGLAANRWTLGPTSGVQRVEARLAVGTGQPVRREFTAAAAPGAPATFTAVGPVSVSGSAGYDLAQPLAVRVSDANGNPVPGVAVGWTLLSGGGTLTPVQAATDSQGVARAGWTLGLRLGSQGARASAAGLGQVAFTAGAGLHASTVLESVTPVPFEVTVGMQGTRIVRLRTADGRPLQGGAILFLAARANPESVRDTTDAAGLASAPWNAPTHADTYAGSAEIDGPRGRGLPLISTLLRATASAPVKIVFPVSGVDLALGVQPAPLRVKVTDQYGNPAPGAPVAWTLQGQGTLSQTSSTSGQDGFATTTLTINNNSAERRLVQARIAGYAGSPVATFAVRVAPAPPVSVTFSPASFTGTVGSEFRPNLKVRDQYGNVYPDSLVSENLFRWEVTNPAAVELVGVGSPYAYHALLRGRAPGTAVVRVRYQGTLLPGSSATITVQ